VYWRSSNILYINYIIYYNIFLHITLIYYYCIFYCTNNILVFGIENNILGIYSLGLLFIKKVLAILRMFSSVLFLKNNNL